MVTFPPRLEILEDRTLLSVCTVDRLTDLGQGSGLTGDLRYCMTQAQDQDSIAFTVTGAINLTRALPDLTHSIGIVGPGPDLLTVQRSTGDNYRIFTVPTGVTVTILGLTIRNGSSSNGGAIFNNGMLTITESLISGNTVGGSGENGGGISNNGTLNVSNSTISENTVGFHGIGGGISNNGGTLTVTNSTISGNTLGGFGYGGGIANTGTLTVTNSTIAGNNATNGGGIFNGSGTLMVTNTTISGNTAYEGGGILIDGGTVTVSNTTVSGNGGNSGGGITNNGTLNFSNTTISGNSSNDEGGGISNTGTLTVSNSTLSGNTTNSNGGGIFNYSGTLTVSNSTLSGNTASGSYNSSGGGIYNDYGTLTVNNSTISGNNTTNGGGGGIYVIGPMTARNTIIAGNTGAAGGPDVYGNLGSLGHNLIGNDSGGSGFHATDLRNINPQLGPLQDNGGPTQTIALLPGSPAVDTGDNGNAPDFDQRGQGFNRIVGGIIDIGAFEAQIGSATTFRVDAPNSVLSGMQFDVTVTALDAYSHVANGYTGTVTFTTTDPDKGVVLPADYTFTLDDGGSHTFTDTGLGETTLITPGNQTITVKDTTDDSITGNAVITVTGGNAPQMGGGNLNGGDFNWMSNFGFQTRRECATRLRDSTDYTDPGSGSLPFWPPWQKGDWG